MEKNTKINLIILFSGLIVTCIVVIALVMVMGKNNVNPKDSNNSSGTTIATVEQPKNLRYINNALSWNKVYNAEKYVIEISGNVYDSDIKNYRNYCAIETTQANYDMITTLSPETTYKIKVTAVGENEERSTSNELQIKTEDVTKGLEYILNEDGESYTVDRGTAKKRGRIVFPDMYNGKPVTKINSSAFGDEHFVMPVPAPIVPVTSVRLPLGCVTIGSRAFKCTAISEIILPKTLKTIEQFAFSYCQSLKTLVMNDGLEFIKSGAFAKSSLSSALNFPDSIKQIETKAFFDTNVMEVNINSIEILEHHAFYNTPWLLRQPDGPVYFCEEKLLYVCKSSETELDEIKISEKTTQIVPFAFENLQANKVIISDGVKVIPRSAFYNSTVKEIVLPSTLTKIIGGAFSGCAKLENIIIPDSVTEIGDGAFFNCSSLKEITIPQGVTKISHSLFQGCENLIDINLPNSITDVGEWAFNGCKSLKEIILPEIDIQKRGIFEDCEQLTNVVILSEFSTYIPANTFKNCKSLRQINLPNSVIRIGSDAFNGSGLQEITIPSNVKEIGSQAFANCENLTKVVFSPSETTQLTISTSAFEKCVNLIEVDLSNRFVKKIGKYAFEDCVSLERLFLPNSATVYDNYVFRNCSSLKSLTMNVKGTLFAQTFTNCNNLESLTLMADANVEIQIDAFKQLSNNFKIYFYGTKEEFDAIDFKKRNEKGQIFSCSSSEITVPIYYYSDTKPTSEGNYWHYIEGVSIIWEK